MHCKACAARRTLQMASRRSRWHHSVAPGGGVMEWWQCTLSAPCVRFMFIKTSLALVPTVSAYIPETTFCTAWRSCEPVCWIRSFIARFCGATLPCDNITECNCACCNCYKSNKQTQPLHNLSHFMTPSQTECANYETVPIFFLFFFWALWLSVCFWFAIELTKTKLLTRISSSESLEAKFVMRFVAVATCAVAYARFCRAIKLRNEIARQNRRCDIGFSLLKRRQFLSTYFSGLCKYLYNWHS